MWTGWIVYPDKRMIFTECSFNGLCVEDVSKQNLSIIPAYSPIVVSIACIIINLSLAMWYLRTVTYQI